MVPGTRCDAAALPAGTAESGLALYDVCDVPLPPGTAPAAGASQPSPPLAESPLARVRRWGRERLGRGAEPRPLPRLRAPSRPPIPQPRRSALGAWWGSRREPGGIEEFLHGRMLGYLFRSRVPVERLPLEIAIEAGGRVLAAPRASPVQPADWVVAFVRANGEPALAVELRRADAELALVDRELAECRQRTLAARRELEDAARAPSLAAADLDAGSHRGRPRVPVPWGVAVAGVVALLVLTEAALLAVPLLRDAGVAPGDLGALASHPPASVALPVLLAVAAAVSVFVFASSAIRRGHAIVDALPPRARSLAHLAAGAASLGLAASLAWAVLGASTRGFTALVLAVALPLAAPPLLAVARPLHAARAEALASAAAWDRVHDAAVLRWVRQSAIVDGLGRELGALEASRAAWAARAFAIRTRIVEVERLAAEAVDAEARELRRLCDAVVDALELDRRSWARRSAR